MTVVVAPALTPKSAGRTPRHIARRLRQPSTVLGLVWLALLVIAGLTPSLLSSQDPLAQDLSSSLQQPSSQHLLGTDKLGRDLLTRLIHGTGSVLLASIVAGLVAIAIGVPLGLWAGYARGRVDFFISRLADGLLSLPSIIILLAVAGILGNNLTLAMAVFGIMLSAGFIRLVRASTQGVRSELFIDAARVQGSSATRIVTRHILPNVITPVIVQLTFGLGIGILAVAGLSFLGLGPPPPAPTWGSMVLEATQNLSIDPWQMVPSGLAIIFTVLSFNFLGDALTDRPEPAGSARPRRAGRSDEAKTVTSATTAPLGTAVAASALYVGGSPTPPLLVVDALTVTFPGQGGPVTVLDNVSLTVRPGEAVALVGESGCGKTVTSRAVLGMLAAGGTIASGNICLDGRDVTALSEKQWTAVRGAQIAYIAQEPLVALDPSFTVASLLMEALRRHRKISRSQARGDAAALLDRVGIPEPESVLKRFAHQLSGGMAQRVAIALALTGAPKILIADEPTTALDVTVQAEILDLLRSLREETEMAVLLVTHDFGVVAEFCSRAIVMYAGQVVEEAPIAELFAAPAHPYTGRLLLATTHAADRSRELPTIEGLVPPPGKWPIGCHFAPRCPRMEEECTQTPIPLAVRAPSRTSRCLFSDQELQEASR